MQDHAMQLLRDYPMVAHIKGRHDEDCKDSLHFKGQVNTQSGSHPYVHVPAEITKAKSALAKQPVAVAIDASHESFHFYYSGVITYEDCGSAENHGVLAVGYGIDKEFGGYWLVRNSWGTSWGEAGYFKVGLVNPFKLEQGFCGFMMDMYYPQIVIPEEKPSAVIDPNSADKNQESQDE